MAHEDCMHTCPHALRAICVEYYIALLFVAVSHCDSPRVNKLVRKVIIDPQCVRPHGEANWGEGPQSAAAPRAMSPFYFTYRVSQKFCPMPNFEEHVTFERVDRISNAVPFWKAYGGSNLKIKSIFIEF